MAGSAGRPLLTLVPVSGLWRRPLACRAVGCRGAAAYASRKTPRHQRVSKGLSTFVFCTGACCSPAELFVGRPLHLSFQACVSSGRFPNCDFEERSSCCWMTGSPFPSPHFLFKSFSPIGEGGRRGESCGRARELVRARATECDRVSHRQSSPSRLALLPETKSADTRSLDKRRKSIRLVLMVKLAWSDRRPFSAAGANSVAVEVFLEAGP